MSDKLLKDGLRTSEKIGGVSIFAELLFVRLLLATCGHGRCPWSPDWILTHALPNRPRTRPTAIAEALQALLSAQLIARYHAPDGTAYLTIPNHGQRFKHAIRSPWPAPPGGLPDAAGQTFMALPGSPPEPDRKKPKAPCVSEPPPHFTSLLSSSGKSGKEGPGGAAPDLRPAVDCLAELAPRWPEHDLRACLRAARHYVRRERGEEAEVTVTWFEQHWLPRAPKRRQPAAVAPVPAAPVAPAPDAAAEAQRLAALAAAPEPERGTLEHALWTEARALRAQPAA